MALAHVFLIGPQNLLSVSRENLKAALAVITAETETGARMASADDCPREADLASCAAPSVTRKAERYPL